MPTEPFYNPELTFHENSARGPFGAFAQPSTLVREREPQHELFGHKLYQPFGIPAGPVMNAKFVAAAFAHGYDVVVYKTVRSHEIPCNPWPNIVPLDIAGDLTLEQAKAGVVSKNSFAPPLSITNSFGVPSPSPEQWQPDMAQAVKAAGKGQLLIASFQGTKGGTRDEFIRDYAVTAKLVAETGAQVIEANLSCPNEADGNLVCFDVETTQEIVEAVKAAVPTKPLVIKVSYFQDLNILRTFVKRIGGIVEGIQAINTIPAKVTKPDGSLALPVRATSGVCGAAIKWAGLEMILRLIQLREELGYHYAVLGVGGVIMPADYREYRDAGADAVLSATGAMWNPELAQGILTETHEVVFTGGLR